MEQLLADTGFFTMNTVTEVLKFSDLQGAQKYISEIIEVHAKTHDVKKENVAKAKGLVRNAKSVKSLALGISNFVLAHESEGFKVIK